MKYKNFPKRHSALKKNINKDLYHFTTGLAVLALVMQLGLPAISYAGVNPGADLDQCANGGVGDPEVQCAGSAWQNGNLNQNQAHYKEGQFVPYRTELLNLTPGDTYTLVIEYDVIQSGKHAIDYIGSYNYSETNADACSDLILGCDNGNPDDTISVPSANLNGFSDGSLNTFTGSQIAGSVVAWNANFTSITYATQNDGDQDTSMNIEFQATDDQVILAWGGHIASREEWGDGNSAGDINGSPYHMRLLDLNVANGRDVNLGNQDRSLSAAAVLPPGNLTVVKTVVNDGGGSLSASDFTITVTDNNFDETSFQGSDTGTSITLINGNYSVTEVEHPDYTASYSDTCNGSITQGDDITCTITNTFVPPLKGSITIVKQADVEGDTEFAFTGDLGNFSLVDDGTSANTQVFSDLDAGTYSVSETANADWEQTSATCSDGSTPDNIELSEDEHITCTFVNTLKTADISVEKTVNVPNPTEGSNVVFSIAITNNGPYDATGIVVEDVLPAGVTYSDDSTSNTDYNKDTGVWTVGDLSNGASAILTITVTVDNGASSLSPITNTATKTQSSPTDLNSDNDSDSADINPGARVADLEIEKMVSNDTEETGYSESVFASVGDTVIFRITVTNNGPDNETGTVTVNDDLSDSFTYVSHSTSPINHGTYDEVGGIWTFDGLGSGEAVILYITVTISENAQSQTVINTATVDGAEVDDNSANNSDTASVSIDPLVDLQVTKTITSEVQFYEGNDITFEIVVTNLGPGSASDVVVTDLIPEGFEYVSASTSIGNYSSSTGQWVIGTLPTSTPESLQLVLKIGEGTVEQTLTNTATSTTSTEDTDSSNDVDSASLTVIPVPPTDADLEVTKLVNEKEEYAAEEGETIYFTISVTNHGPATANGVVVNDILPSEVTFGAATSTVGDYETNTGNWNVGNLSADETATLHIQVTVNGQLSVSSFENTASVNYQDDPISNNNSDTVTVITKYTLTITITGDGTGTVYSDDEGIYCVSGEDQENDCEQIYPVGTVVGLTATPDEGSNFDSSWTVGDGTCTGSVTPCSVTMTSDKALTAHFALNQTPTPPPPSGGGGGGGGGSSASVGIISGTVYNDLNQDGIQNPGEPGLEGWVAYLDLNDNNTFDPGEPFITTDGAGYFQFGPLVPGTYTLRESLQTPWSLTSPNGSGEGEYVIVMNNTPHTLKNFGNTLGTVAGIQTPPQPEVLGERTELPRTGIPAGMLLFIPAALAYAALKREED